MNTLEFLTRVLPTNGIYFAVTKGPQGVRHEPYKDLPSLATRLEQLGPHVDTYFALAGFKQPYITEQAVDDKGNRYERKHFRPHSNVGFLRSFWMDLDIGEETGKYPSIAEAIPHLAHFLKETGLPHPLVVISGRGLHIYWTLTQDILADNWQPVADALRGLAVSIGFKIDGPCTSDRSRILRPVGTFNHKSTPPLPVTVSEIQGGAVDFNSFRTLVETAAKAHGVDSTPKTFTAKLQEEVNVGAGVRMSGPPASAALIADECLQVKLIRDTLGNVPEPLWYAGLQLLHFTKEGDSVAHAWSQGHPQYTAKETQAKIIQIVRADIKPTTCAHFEKVNPTACRDCRHRGNIHSPISLGKHFEEAAPVVIPETETQEAQEIPNPPHPFRRVKNDDLGWIQIVATIDGVERVIYPYDVYPIESLRDEDSGTANGYAVRVRHWLPHDGWREFDLELRLLARPLDMLQRLMQNGILPPAGYDTAVITMIRSWVQELQTKRGARRLSTKMGWVTDPDGFQVGDRLYTKEGKRHGGVSKAYRELAQDFTTKGTLEKWRELTAFFGRPGVEAHAFAFGAAFGAPLMRLTGLNGILINLYGKDGGEGKSLTGALMSSVWREPKRGGKIDDTYNYYTSALTFYSNLPYYIDEVTNLEPEALDAIVYGITQGEGKGRLRADASIRSKGEWQTMLVTSSNTSLRQRLSSLRKTTAAAQMRLLEFSVDRPAFIREWGERARVVLPENWGLAGDMYASVLAQVNQTELRQQLLDMEKFLMEWLGCDSSERFWLGAVTCIVAGLLIAYATGIIGFNPVSLLHWLKGELHKSRAKVETSMASGSESFATFINDHAGERLVVQRLRESDAHPQWDNTSRVQAVTHAVIRQPVGRISIHQDVADQEMWVRRKSLVAWCEKHRIDTDLIIEDLQRRGVLKHANRRMSLGRGTNLGTTVREYCLIIDTSKMDIDPEA